MYKYDPNIDPCLSWSGKAEGMSFEVPNISLHVHERIDPRRIIRNFLRKDAVPQQTSLFEIDENDLPLNKAIEFYSHEQSWSNRLVAGDSLLVMNSLLQKEGMGGKVQMVYIDPPYGIRYNSNFQPFISKRDVKDGKDEDLSAEPEMIKAFRDTWELGIHSYLTYLRDRLKLVRDLLSESGSIFVQISDENVHHVREIMDEIFGIGNFVGQIAVKKTVGLGSSGLTGTLDYLIWYSKDKKQLKFRQLYMERQVGDGTGYTWLELMDGSNRRMTREELDNPKLIPDGSKPFCAAPLMSSGYTPSCTFSFEFEGKTVPAAKYSWKTNPEGVKKLIARKRIIRPGALPNYKLFSEDYPVEPLTNYWSDVRASDVVYVVQTANKVIQRCILMTTDPSDLVLDITCGSGTTAFVAEQWGRRWITCDTSRVAVALAKQRLMTAKFDYYQLAHPEEGMGSGFIYKTVPHVTLKSVANDEPPQQEAVYDQPLVDKGRVRVTGPFTVEAVPSLRTKPLTSGLPKITVGDASIGRTGITGSYAQWMDELRASGIRATGGKYITFARIEPLAGTHFLHAEGEILDEGGRNKRALICFGPDYASLEQRHVENALQEARQLKNVPDFLVFAAFQFDPEAAKDIDQLEWPKVQVLKAQMSADLLTSDLRKKRSSNQSYWLIGQPDVQIVKKDSTFTVSVHGFDYYNPATGAVESSGAEKIAMWMLDTDYDEQSLMPDQVFFPMSDQKRDWTPLAKALNGAVDQDLLEAYTGLTSLPFVPNGRRKIAVKIVDDRGIESLVVKTI